MLFGLALALCVCIPGLPSFAATAPEENASQPVKVETAAFNDFFTSQSQKLYGHLIKAAEYYNSLNKEDEKARPQDALAIRASLSACWELFLNAGDMVYLYDQIDPSCPESMNRIRELVGNGLEVVAGKLEKELKWLDLARDRVKDQPVAVQARQAEKDIRETARAFREYASLFTVKKNDAPPTENGKNGPPIAVPNAPANAAKENAQ
jgi:hypothetical protein